MGTPGYVAYGLLEAESLDAVTRYLHTMTFPQDFKVTTVSNLKDIVAEGKALMAQKTAEKK